MRNVKYGKCVRCGKTYEAVPDLTTCTCGGILDIVYDYDYIKTVLTKEKLSKRENRSMWRYRELLPVEETTPDTPLRVGWSPLYEEPRLAQMLGIKKLWIKDDGQNPTASLKDRASAMDDRITGNTMQFCLHYGKGNEDMVQQAYEILKEGSKILFPLGSCEFSPLCADFIDKFGIRWCLFV